jgi:hypothetical protein
MIHWPTLCLSQRGHEKIINNQDFDKILPNRKAALPKIDSSALVQRQQSQNFMTADNQSLSPTNVCLTSPREIFWTRVARWYVFKPKIQTWVNSGAL